MGGKRTFRNGAKGMNAAKAPNTEPIPGYRLISPLGSGGFGEVWTCEAPGGLLKAVKFVRGESDDIHPGSAGAQQELRAIQHVKALRHPFLLSMDRVEFVGGELVIVMELADRSLFDLLTEYRAAGRPGVPRPELLRYFAEAADVLDFLNQEHGLQHLDVKPHNLFLVGRHIKVADFGLVNSLAEMNGSTANAVLMGAVTPMYAAPESFLGKITLFSDQYSLAVTYYELLVGEPPFAGKNFRQLALQHMQANADLSRLPEVDRPAVGRALAKDPHTRFPSCAAFVDALRTGAAGEASLPPSPPIHRNQRDTRTDIPIANLSSTPVGPNTMLPRLNPPTVALQKRPAADPLDGYQFDECLVHAASGDTWAARSPDGRKRLVRFLVSSGDEKEQERLTRFRALRHRALEPTELVGGEAFRLALIADACTATLASRFQECQAAGLSGVPRAELLNRLTEAAEALDDLFEEYDVRHLGLTPKHLVLRKNKLFLRHFGAVELIHLPAGQQSVLNPRYAAPELLAGIMHPASDAYSLALIYCELSTGVHPFGGLGARQLAAGRRQTPLDLSMVPAYERVVLQRALHADPNRRFASCTDFIFALGAAQAPPAPAGVALADPTLAVTMAGRMRQLINGLVAGAAGDLEVREFRNARYLLRPGCSLDHQFFARLAPGVAQLKVDGFRLQWAAAEIEVNERRVVLLIPTAVTLWQRMAGKKPGLKIQIDILKVASGAVSEVRVHMEPVDCGREAAAALLEERAPALLESLRTFVQAQSERRNQARLPLDKAVQVIPVLDDCTEGDAVVSRVQDISMRGMRIHMPCQPRSQQVNIRLASGPSDHPASLPASVVRAIPCGDGGYEVGLRFLVEERLRPARD